MVRLVRENNLNVEKRGKLLPFLRNNFKFLDKNNLINLLESKRVNINGTIVIENVLLNEGDLVTILTPKCMEPKVNTNYKIIYEDEYLVVVDKPANLPIHPAGKYYFNTLTYMLKRKYDYIQPINRLDRETSGVVLFGKDKNFINKVRMLFDKNLIEKEYLAVCFGKIKDVELNDPLMVKKVGKIRDKVVVDSKGKKSLTKVNLIASSNKFSVVKINIKTGRKHQIRAHLAHIKHPIIGDKQYGNYPGLFDRWMQGKDVGDEIIEKFGASRQLLHCARIEFKHPIINKKVVFKAKTPLDMKRFIYNNMKIRV